MSLPGPGWSDSACPPAGQIDVAAVVRAHGLGAARIDIPAAEADAQQGLAARAPCLEQALAGALAALLGDARDPESAAAMLGQYGHDLLGRPGVELRLVRRHERTPWGESVMDAWTFIMTMPALSDHVYWVRVPRDRRAGTPRSRGFN